MVMGRGHAGGRRRRRRTTPTPPTRSFSRRVRVQVVDAGHGCGGGGGGGRVHSVRHRRSFYHFRSGGPFFTFLLSSFTLVLDVNFLGRGGRRGSRVSLGGGRSSLIMFRARRLPFLMDASCRVRGIRRSGGIVVTIARAFSKRRRRHCWCRRGSGRSSGPAEFRGRRGGGFVVVGRGMSAGRRAATAGRVGGRGRMMVRMRMVIGRRNDGRRPTMCGSGMVFGRGVGGKLMTRSARRRKRLPRRSLGSTR